MSPSCPCLNWKHLSPRGVGPASRALGAGLGGLPAEGPQASRLPARPTTVPGEVVVYVLPLTYVPGLGDIQLSRCVQTAETTLSCLCLEAFAKKSKKSGSDVLGHESTQDKVAGPATKGAGELLKEGAGSWLHAVT